jgi:hypothetical protein
MKLYPILFEQTEPTNEPTAVEKPIRDTNPDRFSGSKYALININDSDSEYVLVNIQAFKTRLRDDRYLSPEEWIAAAGEPETDSNIGSCSGATPISIMVASPLFPAAGYFMYCLMSKIVGGPITSDRGSSTSNSAKKTWARIESSGDWKKVELDNHGNSFDENENDWVDTYFDIHGTWPDRKLDKLEGPKTPPEDDDCKLPKGNSSKEINDKLGTANAYTYTGPYSAERLLNLGEKLLNDTASEIGKDTDYIHNFVQSEATKLFRKYYKGVTG